MRPEKNKAFGFSLIELMMVLAVVGILTAIAYPSFSDQINKSKRATATQSILECAAILERRFTLISSFESNACVSVNNDDYTISVAVTGQTRPNRACAANGKENCFLITATSSLANDHHCKTMSYNELGVKLAYKSDGTTLSTETCWRTG